MEVDKSIDKQMNGWMNEYVGAHADRRFIQHCGHPENVDLHACYAMHDAALEASSHNRYVFRCGFCVRNLSSIWVLWLYACTRTMWSTGTQSDFMSPLLKFSSLYHQLKTFCSKIHTIWLHWLSKNRMEISIRRYVLYPLYVFTL
jgi:hypothetical protein